MDSEGTGKSFIGSFVAPAIKRSLILPNHGRKATWKRQWTLGSKRQFHLQEPPVGPMHRILPSRSSCPILSFLEVISRGVFTSVKDLARKLMRYIRNYNKTATPIRWIYKNVARRITAAAI
jgi:hypothetical protein